MSLPLHVVIISWDGYREKAAAIAQALADTPYKVSIIYSNVAETPEEGLGTWIQVPQSWYYGRKFRASLDLVSDDELMVQIQADAYCHDWPALLESCARSFETYGDIGMWSPDIHWTPWPSEVVGRGMIANTELLLVDQTDGVVWAIHPALYPALKELDYRQNNLGWGIDWVALHETKRLNRVAVRDLAHHVVHPESRGYHNAEAAQHLKNFLAQLPRYKQLEIMQTHNVLESRKKAILAQHNHLKTPKNSQTSLLKELLKMPQPFFKPSTKLKANEAFAVAGQVYLKAESADIAGFAAVEIGRQQFPFKQLSGDPPRRTSIRNFALAVSHSETAYQQFNGLDDWQVDGWHTLRVIPDYTKREQSIAVGGSLLISPEETPMVLSASLAMHRAAGTLVATLSDPKGQMHHEERFEFDAGSIGGSEPSSYQHIEMPLPAITKQMTLRLRIDSYETPAASLNDPAVFFLARPRVRTAGVHVLTPALASSDTISLEGMWYVSDIGASLDHRKHGIIIAAGKERLTLMHGLDAHIKLKNDWGHVLELESNQDISTSFWFNGEARFALELTTGNNSVRVPQEYLTGQHTLLEVRDASGSVVFCRDWVLPRRQLTPLDTLQAETKGPYPSDLFPQSPARFEALRKHLAAGADAKLQPQLSQAITALEAGYDALKRKPLSFPKVKNPDVSIVIPAHNKVNVTYACLAALLLAWNKATFEVILVDDASTDETAKIEDLVSGITVIHNEEAQRFIRACNAGVEKARGKYVVLLNNDTEPTAGWLDALMDAFDRFPNVGLAGSKLLYPDGSLQDAGGIIWNTGDPWNYGNGQSPHDPRFCYARQADYLSGAAMMTTKKIWDELDGLSSYLEPMYFEDTDFAFKVRDAGYSTWFVPSSVVYHYEGMTSGTSTSSGFKRYQEINRPKFKRRWARAFTNFSKVGTTPDLEKDRGIIGRVLFIDYTTPAPDQSAGSYAAIQEIKLVQSLGYKVTFIPENLAYLGRYTHDLEKMGVEVITAPFYHSMNDFLDDRGAEFDAFYITRYHVVNDTAPKIRAVNPQARIIMNNADLHYLRMLRKAIATNDEDEKKAARDVKKLELAAMRSVDVMLSYNDREQAVIEAESEGEVNVMTCPWVLDCPDSVPPRNGRKGLSFLGGFQHQPNVEGIDWFVKNVMTRMEQEGSDLKLSIYGSRMGDDVKALEGPLVDPVGFVDEINDAYDKHMIFVAPLLSGAGIKGKVLSALASGIPCVLSPTAAEGIGLRHGRECMIATTPTEWIDAINQLQNDPKLWQTLSNNAHDLARTQFSFENGRKLMRAAFESADLFGQLE